MNCEGMNVAYMYRAIESKAIPYFGMGAAHYQVICSSEMLVFQGSGVRPSGILVV